MSEFKVRAVEFEEKSVVEQEQELVDRHEKEVAGETPDVIETETPVAVTEETIIDETSEQAVPVTYDIKDEDVLSHIRNRYNKEINSLDDLFSQREANDDLPEDAAAFLKFKRETGRGIEDFVRLNKDYEKMDDKSVLREYYKNTNPEFDEDDISFKIDEYSYDEEFDDEKEVRSKRLALKQELKKAKQYLEQQKEQYKLPLESSKSFVPDADREEFESYKQYRQQETVAEQEARKRSEYFEAKTNELFSDKFEGFGFNVGDEKVVYKPSDTKSIKEQSDITKFVKNFLNEDGYIKDAELFHRAMTIASDPDRFAKFFYEKGKSDGVEGIAVESKNIDMGRPATTVAPKEGFSVRALDGDSVEYKIKSKK